METAIPTQQSSPTHASVPVTPAALTRRLAVGTLASNAVAMLIAVGVVAWRNQPGEWQAAGVSIATSAVAAVASVAVLSMAAGRTVDWLVTFVMGAAAIRLFVSLIGLLIAVQGVKVAPELSAVLISSFYVVTLVVESVLLGRSVGGPFGGKHV